VIGGNLEWKMIGIGALVGVGLILLDTTLGAMKKLRIPPLAVGLGIYLPMSATFAVIVGTLMAVWYQRATRGAANPERASVWGRSWRRDSSSARACGGVLNAGLIVWLSKEAPIGSWRTTSRRRSGSACSASSHRRLAVSVDGAPVDGGSLSRHRTFTAS
jgi:hypothetical protein